MANKKRFTFFTDDYPAVTCDSCYEDQNEYYTGPAIDRLAEYEATGLMPAEVAALAQELKYAKQQCREERRWIPVTERLPKLIPCRAGTAYSEAVNVLTSGRKVITAIYDGTDWIGPFGFWDADGEEVTHWAPVLLPLPEPPKEND